MSYVRVTYPKFQAIKSDGTPAIGYKVYTYNPNTSNAATTYSNRSLSSANSNPIVLDSRGECDIYTSSSIKIVLKTDADVDIWTVDYVAEQQSTFLSGSATAGTTNNAYNIAFTPSLTALTNNLMIVWTPDTDNTDTVGTQSFTGTGPNDCVISGPYSGTTGGSVFQIQIDDATSIPNTFKWRKDSESYTTGVAITGGDQNLKEGISVNFAVLSGHVLNDLWAVTVQKPASLNADSLGAKLIYKNIGGELQLVEGGDIQENYSAICIYNSDQDCYTLSNPSDPVFESAQRNMVRTQTANNYTLSTIDHGTEINFTNTIAKTLTLTAAANFADKFVDVRAGGSADVTIDADGTELIYGRRSPGGAGTYTLKHTMGDAVRITTNGVDWHILNESPIPISRQKITATGDYTKPSGCHTILVQVCGASGGGASDTGYGGGGGGYGEKLIDARAITTVSCTIGAKGVGGLASAGPHDGTAGGTTSFGTHITITGGAAGTAATPGAGGVSSDGDINLVGQIGSDSWGGAGAGPFGGHAQTVLTSDGILYGGGGPPGGAGVDGGDGVAGMILVTEHY